MQLRHDSYALDIKLTYSGLLRIEMLSFQKPGPGGIASAIVETCATMVREGTRDNTPMKMEH